ncbi:MDR family NADP-dependent oxidoreductase [Amycolatopsis sp. CA-230715]|uniref:MDR family NADP-dependent oxidoreductase n=1 Tax=Amycolatopsis sp. CA-230715 TaxID=2745196 RepID=UPI001C00F936|nr:NADP-dependent oxidoreductase [Amycolatopsis sp. CA-230715]QWF85250.1 Putative NADP-dependent oxidoreductase YfmJ [Amycolatopsis sp. CA-230715]
MSFGSHREVRLVRRPSGPLRDGDLRVVEVPVPRPGTGEVLVRNRMISVTAVMRSLMDGEIGLPMPSYEPGQVLWGPAVGEVVEAGDTGLASGDLVAHQQGWREYAAVDAGAVRPVDTQALPDLAGHLSQGVTAWLGVVRGGEVRAGDTVFVTGASGGVGSLAGQVARLRGATSVIGSTGSRSKVDYLLGELGYDAVVVRGEGGVEEQLRAAAPDGIDVVFDNVGGEQLVAALAVARHGARVALVGTMSSQVSGGFSAPVEIDTGALIMRGIKLHGFAVADHLDAVAEATREFGRGMAEGTIVFPHSRLSGIDEAPRALRELLGGRHIGAVVVEL